MMARIAGLAIRAFAGMWKVGMTSKMLPKKTNRKMLSRSGV